MCKEEVGGVKGFACIIDVPKGLHIQYKDIYISLYGMYFLQDGTGLVKLLARVDVIGQTFCWMSKINQTSCWPGRS